MYQQPHEKDSKDLKKLTEVLEFCTFARHDPPSDEDLCARHGIGPIGFVTCITQTNSHSTYWTSREASARRELPGADGDINPAESSVDHQLPTAQGAFNACYVTYTVTFFPILHDDATTGDAATDDAATDGDASANGDAMDACGRSKPAKSDRMGE